MDRVTSPTSQTTNTQTDLESPLSDCETVQISPDRPYRLQLKFTQQTQTDLSEEEQGDRSGGLQRHCSTLLFSQKTQTSDYPGFIDPFKKWHKLTTAVCTLRQLAGHFYHKTYKSRRSYQKSFKIRDYFVFRRRSAGHAHSSLRECGSPCKLIWTTSRVKNQFVHFCLEVQSKLEFVVFKHYESVEKCGKSWKTLPIMNEISPGHVK